jgi:predicted acylesterase/phospholipase RssA
VPGAEEAATGEGARGFVHVGDYRALDEAGLRFDLVGGTFAPVLHEGELQVDGAVLNDLPVDVMRDLGLAGTVIAVNVMPLEDLAERYDFGCDISGPRALLGKLNPLKPDIAQCRRRSQHGRGKPGSRWSPWQHGTSGQLCGGLTTHQTIWKRRSPSRRRDARSREHSPRRGPFLSLVLPVCEALGELGNWSMACLY